MVFLPILSVFGVTLMLFWYLKKEKHKRSGKELRGPPGLPVFGNLFQVVGKMQHEKLSEWAEEYGDIFQLKFGNKIGVCVSSSKLLKEILNDPNFIGRPHVDGFDIYENERLGIVNTEGKLWEVHRRFLLRQLRDFGFGKSSMENLILEEINDVISSLKSQEGSSVSNLKATFSIAVVNALLCIISGQRFKHDDPNLQQLVHNTNKAMSDLLESKWMGLFMLMPALRHYIPCYKAFRKVFDANRKWFEEVVLEHKTTYQDDTLRDFIDVYLAEVIKTTDSNSVFFGKTAEHQLVAEIADMFSAGSDTSSTTLSWAVFYLCKNLGVQKKFQEEIESVTKSSRNVYLADKPNMHYTLALIDEVLRYSSIVANGVPHRALQEKVVQGYCIPQDYMIMPNLYYIHHNPTIWGDPENFRPERFLVNGKYQKSENLLPFQTGRRQCVGETLARDTIFLYLTNIFQSFDIYLDPNLPEPKPLKKPNIILHPMPYSVIMKHRLAN